MSVTDEEDSSFRTKLYCRLRSLKLFHVIYDSMTQLPVPDTKTVDSTSILFESDRCVFDVHPMVLTTWKVSPN